MDRLMACLRASTAASPEVPLEGKAERSARMKAEYLQRQVQGDRSVESKHLHTNEEDVNLELLDLF